MDFTYHIDDEGNRIYDNPNVMKAYVNLGRLSDFILTCQIKSELEYTNICQNVNTQGDTDTTCDFLFNLLIGGFEFMGDIEFPWVGKTGGKIAGWLLSALVDTWKSAPPPDLQNDFNNVWTGIKQSYDSTKIAVDTWREQLDNVNGPTIWNKQYTEPKTKQSVTISQLGDIDYLPNSSTPEFDLGAIAVANQSKYLINKVLVPLRWKFQEMSDSIWWDSFYKRWNSNHDYTGPYYDGLNIQLFFGVYTSFPDSDVVDSQTKEYHYLYFSKEYTENYEHNWFTDDRLYKGSLYKKWKLVNTADGGSAPDSFISYLFTDGYGSSSNGISNHDDIFNNWSMK